MKAFTCVIAAAEAKEGNQQAEAAFEKGAQGMAAHIEALACMAVKVMVRQDNTFECTFPGTDSVEAGKLLQMLNQEFKTVGGLQEKTLNFKERIELKQSSSRVSDKPIRGDAGSGQCSAGSSQQPDGLNFEVIWIDSLKIENEQMRAAFESRDAAAFKKTLQDVDGLAKMVHWIDVAPNGYRCKLARGQKSADAFTKEVDAVEKDFESAFNIRRSTAEENKRRAVINERKKLNKTRVLDSNRFADLIENHGVSNKMARRAVGCIVREQEQSQLSAGLARKEDLIED